MPVTKNVIIGLPTYDNRAELETIDAIQAAMLDPENPVRQVIRYAGDSLVNRARNEVAARFMAMPPDEARYLMFIDSDIIFKPSDIARLAKYDMPVVAGMYFLKNLNAAPVMNTPIRHIEGTSLVHVKQVGTGFLMIRRDAFASLISLGYVDAYRPGSNQHDQHLQRHNLFPVEVMDGFLQSEDYAFCELCAKANIQILLDREVIVGHKGWAVYPIRPHHLIKALTTGLNLFAEAKESETTVKDADIEELLKAYETYRSRLGRAKPDETKAFEHPAPVVEEFTA